MNAGVIRSDVIHFGGIPDVVAGGVRDVFAARTMATLAAYVPLDDLSGVRIEVDGMATIASGACGALHVVGGIERRPPIGAWLDEVRKPLFVNDVPLSGQPILVK